MKIKSYLASYSYKFLLLLCLLTGGSILLYSCANQLPPSGGENDIIPPQVVRISPEPNTTNFNGNSIEIEFDEYIDRRSFQDALFISPQPKSPYEVNINGTEVEIYFPEGLDKNKTFSIYIGKDLKDVRNGNAITKPIQFAISTGNKIDKGQISGQVYTRTPDRIIILAFNLFGKATVNPAVEVADFISQLDEEGNFVFQNLPGGRYRVFALRDNDRNLIYDESFDELVMPVQDYEVADDKPVEDADFMVDHIGLIPGSEQFYSILKPGPDKYIYSSVTDSSVNLPSDAKFYFYFKDNDISRFQIADNLTLTDTNSGANYKLIYNWLSDSLLQVFSLQNFVYGADLRFTFDLTGTARGIIHTIDIKITDESNTGKISGQVFNDSLGIFPVFVRLYNNSDPFIFYSKVVEGNSLFSFPAVVKGKYSLFSFVDSNNDGEYSRGKVEPFEPAERFIFYSEDLDVKGRWTLDNVFLRF